VFKNVQRRDDITIASSTMDVTVRRPKKSAEEAQLEAQPQKNRPAA
ncbi:MAG: hypothetical protein JOY79_12075, partial [Acidobacteriaceae bacterium]|nr:hypothetical protein [Acidobacteriaceae bacterium]